MYRNLTEQQLDEALTDALRVPDEKLFEQLSVETDRREAEREIRLNLPGALARAARWYATQSIAVFPLQPLDKKPFGGSRGFKDATIDPGQVSEWWEKHPDANIGLPTGHQFDVIDIDGPIGYSSYLDLRDAGELPECIGKALTPGDSFSSKPPGMHYYIRPTGDGNTAGLLPGIDYRGRLGYVVAPPSLRPDGRYKWTMPLNLTGGAA